MFNVIPSCSIVLEDYEIACCIISQHQKYFASIPLYKDFCISNSSGWFIRAFKPSQCTIIITCGKKTFPGYKNTEMFPDVDTIDKKAAKKEYEKLSSKEVTTAACFYFYIHLENVEQLTCTSSTGKSSIQLFSQKLDLPVERPLENIFQDPPPELEGIEKAACICSHNTYTLLRWDLTSMEKEVLYQGENYHDAVKTFISQKEFIQKGKELFSYLQKEHREDINRFYGIF